MELHPNMKILFEIFIKKHAKKDGNLKNVFFVLLCQEYFTAALLKSLKTVNICGGKNI